MELGTSRKNMAETIAKKSNINFHREKMCPIYASFFNLAKIFGIFPYSFDPDTLKVSPVRTGFFYYLFLFNMVYLSVTTSKVAILFLENWRTNFEFETFKGGYYIQLTYLSGHLLHFTMLCGIVLYKDKFAYAASSAIRVEAKVMQEFFTPATNILFLKRFKLLSLQYWVIYVGFGVSCSLLVLVMEYFLPELPGNLNSVLKRKDGVLLFFLILYEAYLAPLACGIISGSNLVIYITFGGIQTNIAAFNTMLAEPMLSQRDQAAVVKAYQLVNRTLQPLASLFSFSFILQEYNFLMAVSLFIVGAAKMAGYDSLSLAIWCYGTALWMFTLLIIQFYPMIAMNLLSEKTVNLMNHLILDKAGTAEARMSRVLKVRPMGLHTIGIATVSDYVTFIASMLLMFLKE